ncbi:hypothetical protein LshimejAT787_0401550 [Lyophyllum shimeji]|uniref:Uncharacterized protein n=1 Tax=Lyophyllum shimeji TaxID=47721 RepID=A0A9P3UJL7_LYOSH|nr:hypothetical protein LshimejAT787_0401550 [Lyophyllum shimeji]
MGLFAFFSYSARSVEVSTTGAERKSTGEVEATEKSSEPVDGANVPQPPAAEDAPKEPATPASPPAESVVIPTIVVSQPSGGSDANRDPVPEASASDRPQIAFRRFSLRNFSITRSHEDRKPALSAVQEHDKEAQAAASFSKRSAKARVSSSDKRAKESALIVRSLIVGPSAASPKVTPANAKPQLKKVKSQLMKPKSANKVIAHLRALPISDASIGGKESSAGGTVHAATQGPIHAVCLEHPDAVEDKLHFASLNKTSDGVQTSLFGGSASIDQLTTIFDQMNIVNLVKAPDLGLGQPGDGEGLLAGAVPTAETVINGIEQITPQLMALGYATGRAVVPDHRGIYPPTDRMSVLTYWWGLELVLPTPSLQHLASAHSVAGTVVNFLTALSLINNGVREILPFVRYISQFIDFEFNAIKGQDKGRGVVCAATWIMPAAMVPRPWDFPDPPADAPPANKTDDEKADPPAPAPPSETVSPPAPSPPPVIVPPSLPTFVDGIVGAYADSVHFQPDASSKTDLE